MQLTEDERAALERFRTPIDPLGVGPMEMEQRRRDAFAVAHVMTRLFPVRTYGEIVIRWDDEITPERLVACGFVYQDNRHVWPDGEMLWRDEVTTWRQDGHPAWRVGGAYIVREALPRNMEELWNLMERCGIEEGGK